MKIKYKSYGKTVERELQPCPNPGCCSTGYNIELITGTKNGKSQFDRVTCKSCGVTGPWYDGHPDDAVNGWNDLPRTTTVQKSDTSQELEKEINKICLNKKLISKLGLFKIEKSILDTENLTPYWKVVLSINLENIQDCIALFGRDKTALKIGREILNTRFKGGKQ